MVYGIETVRASVVINVALAARGAPHPDFIRKGSPSNFFPPVASSDGKQSILNKGMDVACSPARRHHRAGNSGLDHEPVGLSQSVSVKGTEIKPEPAPALCEAPCAEPQAVSQP